MIFIPYPDESNVISDVNSIRNSEYALVRLTPTMIEKNNTDCNGFFRSMLKKIDVVDYDMLGHGKDAGVYKECLFIHDSDVTKVKMNFYVVNNSRGDKRWSLYGLKDMSRIGLINVGDLLMFSSYVSEKGETIIFLVNLTHNIPDTKFLLSIIGVDEVNKLFERIKPALKDIIINKGYIPNYKGVGKEAPKDIGETLEHQLNVETNNRNKADIDNLIELKGKGSSSTKDTLFTLRPSFDGTYISRVEPNDTHRVKVFPIYYGYPSTRHEGCNDLYVTIGIKEAPQNKHGLYLEVDEKKNIVKLMGPNCKSHKIEMAAFWKFDDLEKSLMLKHKSTLWIDADKEMKDGMMYYNFKEIEFSRAPKFATFIALIKSGEITYDWRGHTSLENIYSGVNKGNAWRIKPASREKLFGSIETVDFS